MDVKQLTSSIEKNEFYPTPKELVDKMLCDINWTYVSSILEPSAGKGDIVKSIRKTRDKYYEYLDVDCIEIDTNLQHILRGEGFRVVHDNFLTFNTLKQYSLIIMNPPFSNGDKHLMKALKMQENGGNIICLLNAETLKNPYSIERQSLIKTLNKYNANIEYIQNAFVSAERKTNVEVALIKVSIPKVVQESEIYERMKKAIHFEEVQHIENTEIVSADFIKAIISQYNIEIATGVELIRVYNRTKKYISSGFDSESSMIKLSLSGHEVIINNYVQSVRMKYWKALLSNKEFIGQMTSNLRKEYYNMVDTLKDYEFSEYNIQFIAMDITKKINIGVEDTIMSLFDRLTCEHSWYPETKNNRHYYDGWSHNKAHKINKKVILPCYGVWNNWDNKIRSYEAVRLLEDIEKTLNYLDSGRTENINLNNVIEAAQDNPKNIQCKFFKVSFYKKGTVHITFTNLDLLEKFNIYAAKNRCWLPPDYGKKEYKNLDEESQKIIEEFQGQQVYDKVYKDNEYYLKNNSLLMITNKQM